jgi:hypothetical protein
MYRLRVAPLCPSGRLKLICWGLTEISGGSAKSQVMVRIIVIRFFIAGPVLSFYESFFGYICWGMRKK